VGARRRLSAANAKRAADLREAHPLTNTWRSGTAYTPGVLRIILAIALGLALGLFVAILLLVAIFAGRQMPGAGGTPGISRDVATSEAAVPLLLSCSLGCGL
jgi:hypothetical protein